ncbi:MAG: SLC13 family permease [Anaerolineales bacterium]|nr:SLC13 family permease [Anaerolineales bacterium]
MTPSGWITLAVIAIAAILLITERVRPDLTALLVALSLRLMGVISTEEALSGFSQSAVITILSIFILTNGLERTGITGWVGRQLLRLAGETERRLVAVLALTSAFLAAFMNTIAAAAVLLPITMGIARELNFRPSRLLMPLGFGALLGGTTTLLTTANIIVSSTLSQAELAPFGLFEFMPIGLPLVIGGTLLMLWLAPMLLPARDVAGEIARMTLLHGELAQIYHLREGTSEVLVKNDSIMGGQTLKEGGWSQDLGLMVLGILRENRLMLAPKPDDEVQYGDILLLDGIPTHDQLQTYGMELTFDSDLVSGLASMDVPLVEATLAPRSELEGLTLRQIHFRERYGLQVIALWREGLVIQHEFADIPLRFGDAMLLQGPRSQVRLLRMDPNFLILEEELEARPGPRALLAGGIMIFSLGLAATQVLPIAVATLLGAALMVLTRCLSMDQAYRAVEWRAIFLIAGMLPLSIALQSTSAASVLAQRIFQIGGLSPLLTAIILMLTASALSLFLSGQTAAVVMAPIAIAAAGPTGIDPRALAMGVAIGCSLAFISPLGHPANLLMMGPGGYTFRDYFKLGIPLTIITVLIATLGLHWVWGI